MNETDQTVAHIPRLNTREGYYADTAYTDGRIEALGTPLDKDRFTGQERLKRQYDMPGGKVCAHVMPRIGKEALSIFSLFGEEKFKKEVGDAKLWEEYEWATLRNKKAVWFQVTRVALLLVFIHFFTIPIALYHDLTKDFPEMYLIFSIPFLFYFFARYMTKISDNSNNYVFNRRTGLVSIPRKGQKPFVRPFYEFIPYYAYQSVMHGTNWFLYLGHRDEAIGALEPSGSKDPRTAFADWTLLQWFMDVNLPLPDSPETEPYRHLDPTTADYDKKTGRPERYWRDMNYYKAEKLYYNECDRLNQFDANNPHSWRTVPDDYMQWPHLVELEPAKATYEDFDEEFDRIQEEKKQKKLAKQRQK